MTQLYKIHIYKKTISEKSIKSKLPNQSNFNKVMLHVGERDDIMMIGPVPLMVKKAFFVCVHLI